MDRAYKINNTWLGFQDDISKLVKILIKMNLFPTHLIERVVNRYITGTQNDPDCPPGPTSNAVPPCYFKLPYTGHFSSVTQKRIRQLIKRYCNNIDIKLVFSSFKIGNIFGVKAPYPQRAPVLCCLQFFCVRAVMPVTSAKPPDIFPHPYVNTYLLIGPLTYSNA